MTATAELDIRIVGYDSDHARALTAQVQAEYVVRYGGPDESPIDDTQFAAPDGVFLIGYRDGEPVAMGGWRRMDDETAEIKRMYVAPSGRRRGFSRRMLGELESLAARAGFRRVVLETGTAQPEAVGLYASCGYVDVEPFGHYADAENSIHLGKALDV